MEYYQLNNGCSIPAMIMGTYQIASREQMDDVVLEAVKNGSYGFDTSPSYGTEKILGESIHEAMNRFGVEREKFFITDKIDGIQMCKSNGNIEGFVDESLKSMNTDYLDLLLVHWPFMKYMENTWRCMEKLVHKGKVKSIGLSNIDADVFNDFMTLRPEIIPQVIQNEISPLNTMSAETGFFTKKNIRVEAYSSLCRMIGEIRNSDVLRAISAETGKSIPQVILRWNYQRKIIPVFKSRHSGRVLENLRIFDFCLTDKQIDSINQMNRDYRLFPQSYGCPGY